MAVLRRDRRPLATPDAAQRAVTLAGPIVHLLGELLFRIRMIRRGTRKRMTAIAVLAALGTIAAAVSAVVLGLLIALTLILLALWEYEPLRRPRTPLEPPPVSDPDLLSIVPVHGNQE